MTLIYPGGGNCDPNEEPCVGPDCIDTPTGDPEDPTGTECLINCGGPTTCTGPDCVNGECTGPDCSYDEEGDWHVYWMCDTSNVPVNLGEVIVLNPSSPSSDTMEVLQSQNKHFGDSDSGFQQLGLNKIQIGDTFQKVDSNDYIIVGEDGTAFTTIYPCFTYLGKKFADSPGQAVANGATYTEVPWTNGSTYNYSKNGEPCDCTTAPPPPPPETGCQDPAACNYNSEATIHDEDSCCYDGGCTDEAAVNYNPNICCDNGTCCYIPGCTDPNATNYDSTACFDDGSCCLSGGCTDSAAFNYNALACEDDGSCCYTSGCTDPTATNYDLLACYDDGSCEYCESTETNSCETNGATNMNEYWNAQNIENNDHFSWFVDPNNYQIPFGSRYFEIDADVSPCGEGGGGPKDGGVTRGGGGTDDPCTGPNNGHYMLIPSYEVSVDLKGSQSGTTQSQTVGSWNEAMIFLNSPIAANNPIFNENMDWATVQQWLGEVFQGWNISIADYECCECTGSSTCGCTDPTAANYNSSTTFDDGSCIYESWDCDPVDGCYNLGTSSGLYSSLAACVSLCGATDVAISFDCTDNGCVDPLTGNGAYASLIACETVCNVVQCDGPFTVISTLTGEQPTFTTVKQLWIKSYIQGHSQANVYGSGSNVDVLTVISTKQLSSAVVSFDADMFYLQVESGHTGATQWDLYSDIYPSQSLMPVETLTLISETLNPAATSNSGLNEWTYVFHYDHNIPTGGATGFAVNVVGQGVAFIAVDTCTTMGSISPDGIVKT